MNNKLKYIKYNIVQLYCTDNLHHPYNATKTYKNYTNQKITLFTTD